MDISKEFFVSVGAAQRAFEEKEGKGCRIVQLDLKMGDIVDKDKQPSVRGFICSGNGSVAVMIRGKAEAIEIPPDKFLLVLIPVNVEYSLQAWTDIACSIFIDESA